MTTSQINELWDAHCATTTAAMAMRSAKTREERNEATEAYRAAELRFYHVWHAALMEAEPDPEQPIAPTTYHAADGSEHPTLTAADHATERVRDRLVRGLDREQKEAPHG